MNKILSLMKHLDFFLKIGLMCFVFQSCKVVEGIKGTSSSAIVAEPQIIISSSTNYIKTSSHQLAFEINNISANNILSVTCQLNDLAPQNCSSKIAQLNMIVDGNYTLKIVVQPKIGKKIEISKIIVKDSLAPSITVSSQPSAVTNQTSGNFNFSANDALSGVLKLECSFDNSNFNVCSSPVTLPNLAVGNHSYKIRATDKAGNVSSIYSYSWTIDLSVPTIIFSQMPKASSSLINSIFAFSGSGMAKYECQLDTANYSTCTSPITLNNLSVGSHTFKVKGINSAGTAASAVVFNWQVDNVAPAKPVITSNVQAKTNQASAQFSFVATDVGSGILKYQCALDSDPLLDCLNPKKLDYVSQGAHSFKVVALDMAGNISEAASFSWNADSVAPTAPVITPSVLALTKLVTAQFSFTSTDSGSGLDHFECTLDAGTFAICTSPANFASIAVGSHQFKVKAFDKFGNVSTISIFNWVIDTIGPTISFSQTPSKVFVGRESVFKFQVTDSQGVAAVKCNWISPVEASTPIDCSAGTVSYSLPPEGYALKIEAIDKAGNVSVKNYGWDVDDGVGTILKFKSIDAGSTNVCGITFDDKVKCWGGGILPGFYSTSLAIDKANITGVKSITSGNTGYCVLLNDNSVSCWGGGIGMDGAKGLSGVKSISSGSYFSCALLDSGSIKCWGSNNEGMLGNNSIVNSAVPVEVAGINNAKAIFAGYNQACAILTNDIVKCWGQGILMAQEKPALAGFKFIDLSSNQNCGINAQNDLMCWNNSPPPYSTPPTIIQGISKVKSLSINQSHACVINVDNKVICFGSNRGGLLGSLDPNATMVEVAGLENAKAVTASGYYTCVLTAEDTVKCWGVNSGGELGYSQSTLAPTTTDIPSLTNVKAMDSSGQDTCALTYGGTIKCWGNEVILGNGNLGSSEIPLSVPGLNDAKSISTGLTYKCAQHNDDTVSCWGSGYLTPSILVPTKIVGLSGVKSIAASWGSACATMNNGTVKCWGTNSFKNLGVDSIESSSTPIEIPNLKDVVKVVAAGITNCALDSIGAVKCWGEYITAIPTSFPELANLRFKDLTGGDNASYCGITTTNEEVCFALNATPLEVTNFGNRVLNAVQLSASNTYNNCILNDQSVAYCYGYNEYGRLGQYFTLPYWSSWVLMNTPKPINYVLVDGDKNYFIYSDKSVGFIGKKYNSLYGPSAVIKDPR